MVPRQKLLSSPYAIKSRSADRLSPNAVAEGDLNVQGSIKAGNTTVVDSAGKWIGDPTGLQGPQGIQGPAGLAGQTGPKGDKGDAGQQGPPGVKGDKGDTGSQGTQGIQGVKGDKGDKGDTGAQGLPGASPFSLVGNDAVYPQGNIGIGTASPQGKLHVEGIDGYGNPAIYTKTTGSNGIRTDIDTANTDVLNLLRGAEGALLLVNANPALNNWAMINFYGGYSTSHGAGAGIGAQHISQSPPYKTDLAFFTSDSGDGGIAERMRITNG
ncbi:MAG: collagen-like protein, partial [Elusimicrobia bacterium]|nr:collagen-like protein [Elusimicrobiota bacterium]